MYKYEWDEETGGLLLMPELEKMSLEPRPVYYRELDILGFDKYWNYEKDDSAPYLFATANKYYYRGRLVAKTKGGALYTAPELEILEEPEPNDMPLRFVDIERMVEKNCELMETLEQDTIRKIYNTYRKYRNKVDVFYVAFSGGKDSIVTLDLAQRALPHDEFLVLFGDTGMEFPDTYDVVNETEKWCEENEIKFYKARSHLDSLESWKLFGPPARRVRWCCSVHKSVPVLNLLNKITNNENGLRSVMITGVRADESEARSNYESISLGKKIAGQYSFHPLLEWSSAEIYIYIFMHNNIVNEAYKLGFNRVGCIMCPNSSKRHEYLKQKIFPKKIKPYCDIIVNSSRKDLEDNRDKIFLEEGGWKARFSGRELKFSDERLKIKEDKQGFTFTLNRYNKEWIMWYKTIGEIIKNDELNYKLEYQGTWRNLNITFASSNKIIMRIKNDIRTKNSIEFRYYFKSIIIKSLYCVRCKLCEVECSYRNISFSRGKLLIDDKCCKCKDCLKITDGCIYYSSVRDSEGLKAMKGINRYLSIGVSGNWIKQYFKDETFEPGNRKTDVMFGFLNDAGVTKKKKFTHFGDKIKNIGLDEDNAWALMLCNLVYTPAYNWFVKNIPFDIDYTDNMAFVALADDVTQKAKGEFWSSFKIMLYTMPYGNSINLAIPDIDKKILSNGTEQLKMKSLRRGHWLNPDPCVILYSLYKFAENCGDIHQFSLETLLDDSIERDGVSPTRIFGLDKDTMMPILNGLSANYPDFISASFNLGLDSITLRKDKKSEDVLELF